MARFRYLTQVIWDPRLPGRTGAGDRRDEHPASRGDRPLGGGAAGGVAALVSSASALVMTPRSLPPWPGTTPSTLVIRKPRWPSPRP